MWHGVTDPFCKSKVILILSFNRQPWKVFPPDKEVSLRDQTVHWLSSQMCT